MCGRFSLTASPEEIARRFELGEEPEWAPRYNVAPGQDVLAIRAPEGRRRAVSLRWGLVPAWAESPAVGARLVNARCETAASKPAFREAFRARRCIVPADGFYEWAERGGFKHPYLIGCRGRALFGIAALWERWQSGDQPALETCTLLTTHATGRLRELHDRSPAILDPADYAAWLDPEPRDLAALSSLLRRLPEERLVVHPVSPRVNRVEVDDAACIEPVAEPPRQTSLF